MMETANRLSGEKSPYLLQHALNPVDWYPWGEEAFARARKEDKPVFLSIGYSTCHWCHVMAHESFESEAVADLLNRWFVSIKVDREERPDIDQMYMAAAQALTGAGGWPLSVFLLPDGEPFYAGTYFPPLSSPQRPGFGDLLRALHHAWEGQRGELQEAAQRLVASLGSEPDTTPAAVGADVLPRCFGQLVREYDREEGGFGQAPKFPRPAVYTFLFSHDHATGERQARDMALATLDKMAAGGMYDHIGGGFHRYSVDGRWFVPHFEKMLYDQAQLADAYLDGFLITGEHRYARVADEILHYLLRDMRDPEGGFYSAEDADSDDPYVPGRHGEGAFYLWTEAEISRLLGLKEAELFCFSYGVKPDGNVAEDPLKEFTGRNILFRAHGAAAAARRFALGEDEVERRLRASREVLLRARSGRTRPHCDDKIITAWNGLLIGALARGSRVLQKPPLLEAAVRAARFIRATLYDERRHSVHRRYRQGEAGCAGQLADYTCLVAGLLELYEATQEPPWLRWARSLTHRQIDLFWHEPGGFFYDSVVDASVKLRMRSMYDGAEPTGNSLAAGNLFRLSILLQKKQWREMAQRVVASFAEILNHYPPALPLLLAAWYRMNATGLQVVIAGEREGADTEALRWVVDRRFHPDLQVLLADGGENQRYLAERLPFLGGIEMSGGRATAYVCRDCSCGLPVTGPDELEVLLASPGDGAAQPAGPALRPPS